MDVDSRRVLAFRLAGQGLAAGTPDALAGWAVQDSPPGAAVAALLARGATVAPGWLDDGAFAHRSLAAFYNARTATAVVGAADAAAYATAMIPADDAGLKAIVGPALPERSAGLAEPVAQAVAAIGDALDGAVLSRDDLHEQLRARLAPELLPWCEGCQSHHARRGLLVMAALQGRLCLAGRVGRQPAFARTDQWLGAWDAPPVAEAGAELVRRYLRGYGPSTRAHFAAWSGLGTRHAKALWESVAGELAAVRVDGAPAWLLAADAAVLEDPPPAPGVRLLAPGDPLLLGRDREALLADPAARKQVWRALGGAGIALADGVPVALWRARKQGRRLVAAVDALDGAAPPRAALLEALERLAPHRGCASVELSSE